MDWLKEFENRFGTDEYLVSLGAKKMHGSIQINFCDGKPVNYNLTIHKRGAVSYSNNAVYTTGTSANSTQTKGE